MLDTIEPRKKSKSFDSGISEGPEITDPVSPAVDLSTLITLQANGSGISSTLVVNLESYIESYKAEDLETHALIKDGLLSLVSGLAGSILWKDMLKCAMDNAVAHGQLSPDECKCLMLENLPINVFLRDGLVEIVKNVMDEAIIGYYQAGKQARLELTLAIDLSVPDQIGLMLTDTGRGFSETFLKKMSILEGQDAYILGAGSDKQRADQTMPTLFGGVGLGLRILMAQILHGAELMRSGYLKQKYEKSAISEIRFSNRESSSGAQIQITTSRAPLQEKVDLTASLVVGVPSIKLDKVPQKVKQAARSAEAGIFAAKKIMTDIRTENTEPNGDDSRPPRLS